MSKDTIYRQDAIDAICNACGKIDCDKMDKCEKLQLPPANCSEFPNNSDTISRQAAIDALKDWYDGMIISSFRGIAKVIDALPPVQPETALDEWEYKGKTLRQWVEIILATDINVATKDGTDCISRQAVLNEFCHSCDGWSCNPNTCCKTEWIRKLPVIQPERKECEEREQGKCPWYAG